MAAILKSSSLSISIFSTLTTLNTPFVKVPVLSNTTVSTSFKISK